MKSTRRDANGARHKHYANKADWLMAGEWCDRRAAFASLGRSLSLEYSRRAFEEEVG